MRIRWWRSKNRGRGSGVEGRGPGSGAESLGAGCGAAAGAVVLGAGAKRRVLLKALLAGAGVAGLDRVLGGPRVAEATYTAGTPSDTVDTNLTVQGDLIVRRTDGTGNVGIGTTTPQGRLDVAGDIRINGTQVIGTDGVIKQSYYAQ